MIFFLNEFKSPQIDRLIFGVGTLHPNVMYSELMYNCLLADDHSATCLFSYYRLPVWRLLHSILRCLITCMIFIMKSCIKRTDNCFSVLVQFRGFCRKSLQADSWHSNEYELCPPSRRHLSVFIRSGIHTVFALTRKETVSISVQSHSQVHRWCTVNKQPRIWKLSGPNVSCWTWNRGHYRERHFRFIPISTTVDWEEWSTSHFHLQQTRWFQFPHNKRSVPEK